jgi:coenzyme PQQ precursor peptide PqqA
LRSGPREQADEEASRYADLTDRRRSLSKREIALSLREIGGEISRANVEGSILRACAVSGVVLGSIAARSSRRTPREDGMTWKTPKIVEVPVGMEINMYACAARK